MAKTVTLDTKALDKLIKTAGEEIKTYIVHDGVEYGIYVEFGTTRQAAQPALVPAFEENTKALPEAIGQAIERGVPLDNVLAATAFAIQGGYQKNVPVDTGALKNSIGTRVE